MPREVFREEVHFLPTGCSMLDLCIGGGWAEGRIINIVGDKSVGKTLIGGIEACAQFAKKHDVKRIRYVEAESAFDEEYAESMGMPAGVDYNREIDTVEAWYEDIDKWLDKNTKNEPCMYILDSLDALSDAAEMERDMEKGSYGGEKAKKLSQFFRRLVRKLAEKNCTLIIISQIRDKMNVMFGETKTRSGGRALDFYASQIVWLVELGKIKVAVRTIDRIIGVEVRAKCRKNKVGTAQRECDFIMRFGYGVDDEITMLNWLKDVKEIDAKEWSAQKELVKDLREKQDRKGLLAIRSDLKAKCTKIWYEIEEAVSLPMRKYD